MKKLGFGLMRLPLIDALDKKSIDMDQARQMVDLFLGRGFTYFDTAWMYHDFSSENAVKELLSSRYPRDSYTIATKLHADFFDSKEEIEEIFSTQLSNCGVDYFDYYLLHDTNFQYYEKYKKFGCYEWIHEKKKSGKVRTIGFSFHDTPELLDRILTEYPFFDFVQLQINYLDWDSPAIQSGRCYDIARAHGKEIVVMEPVKGGILSILPEEAEILLKERHPNWSKAEWAIRFAASLPGVIMVLSGMSTIPQVEDNTSYMSEFEPLSEDDVEILKKCAQIINQDAKIPCTGCSYCTDGCAAQIPIPT